MKTFKIFITSLLLFFLSEVVQSQPLNCALFIHGFEGGEESWISSSTPVQWKDAGIIDHYVIIEYETDEITTASGQNLIITRIANSMSQSCINGRWVLVGHSLGG